MLRCDLFLIVCKISIAFSVVSIGCFCSKRYSVNFELQLLFRNACRCLLYQIKKLLLIIVPGFLMSMITMVNEISF